MRRFLATIFGLALFVGVAATPAFGGSGPTYNVQVGAFYADDLPASGNNFYPEQMSIHPADQLHFTSDSFHTATLLPVNEDPDDWIAANAAGLDTPYGLLHSDPDDGTPAFKYNAAGVFFPSCFFCGGASSPCPYDGSSVVNSGIALDGPMDFTTRLDVPAGSTVWAICLIHAGMRMEIDVVDEGTPVQTQAEMDAARAAKIADEEADARALHEQLLNDHSSHMENGHKVWDMSVGYDTDDFALLAFYPASQRVRKGQSVEWHFGSLVSEDHTVSIDKERATRKITSKDFLVLCDPDGDSGPGPDTPPELEGPPFCNDPSHLEVDAATKLVTGAGDGRYKGGTDLESAAARGGGIPGAEAFQVDFPKDLDKTVKYICSIHPFMVGRIVM